MYQSFLRNLEIAVKFISRIVPSACFIACFTVLLSWVQSIQAQSANTAVVTTAAAYPNKPIKFIVPYAPGGLPDTVARVIAQKLGEKLGQSVVIDNKPGGNGVVAFNALMTNPIDGHTFIVSDGSMLSITPLINKTTKYDVNKDFLPVSLIARSPLFLAAPAKLAAHSLQEFVALVKSKPGEFTYGSSGIGSSHHLTMEAMKAALDLNIRHVPYRGSGQSVPALVGGQVDALFSAMPSLTGFVKSGQVKLLASNAGQRSATAKDVPSIAELIPGFDFSVVIGVLAPAGSPPQAIARISAEISQITKMTDMIQTLQNAGIEPVGAGPADYAKAIARENDLMGKAGKVADLKAE
jgi:tripartite-type tricarboxylate transporter receptor subunit TctC